MLRRKIRRERKLRNIKFFPIFCIMMLLLGSAYALLSQEVNLKGTVTIESLSNNDNEEDDGYEKNGLEAKLVSHNSWGSQGSYTAIIAFNLTNNYDFDTDNWFIEITIPNTQILGVETWESNGIGIKNYGIDNEKCTITIGSTKETDHEWRAVIRSGETKMNLNIQLTINTTSNLDNTTLYAYTKVLKTDDETESDEIVINSNNYNYNEKKSNTTSENTIINTIINSNENTVTNNSNIVENSNTVTNTSVENTVKSETMNNEVTEDDDTYTKENEDLSVTTE